MSYTPPPDSPPGGYGGPSQGGYSQPGPGYGGYGRTVDHPQGTTVLVLGICSLVFCLLLGPVAWIMGNNAIQEIDANPSRYGNRGSVSAGRICGMIASVLMAIGVVVLIIVVAAAAGTSSTD